MFTSLIYFSFFLIIFIVLFLIIHAYIILKSKKTSLSSNSKKYCKTIAVVGSGGHTSELIELLKSLSEKYYPRLYIMADTDKRSLSKIINFEKNDAKDKEYVVLKVKRSREVAQSWVSTIYSTFIAFCESFSILLRHNNADLILCNGPGTCVPVCLASFLLRLFFLNKTKIIFVESICRVKTLSLSGRILYYFADYFVVQWPDLLKSFPNAVYLGTLV